MAEVERQQPLTLDFSQGLNEARQSELLPPQGFTRLENVRQRHKGAVVKRFGFSSFASTRMGAAVRTGASRVYAYANSHAVVDNGALDVFSASANAYRFVGRLPEIQATRDPVAAISQGDINGGMFYADAASVGAAYGYLEVVIHIRNDSSTWNPAARYVYATVYDPAEQVVVGQTTLIAAIPTAGTTFAPQVVAADGRVFVIYQDISVTTDLYTKSIDLRSSSGIAAGWSAAVKVTDTTSSAMTTFDVCQVGARWLLAYKTALPAIRLRLFDATGAVVTSVNYTGGAAGIDAMSVAASGDTAQDAVWVVKRGSSSTLYATVLRASDLAFFFGETLLLTASGNITSFHVVTMPGSNLATPLGYLVASTSVGYQTYGTRIIGSAGATATTGALAQPRNLHHASRPWVQGGRIYCAYAHLVPNGAGFQSNAQNRNFWVGDLTDNAGIYSLVRPVANLAPRIVTTLTTDYSLSAGAWAPVGRPTVRGPNTIGLPFAVQRNNASCTVQMANLDYVSNDRWSRADASDGLHLSGGVPMFFDGQQAVEENFIAAPYIESAVVTADGSGFAAALGVKYVAVWEWTDAMGNVHRSGMSNIWQTGTFAALSKVDVSIQLNYGTTRIASMIASSVNAVWAAIYRTENNGVTFYRCGAYEMTGGARSLTFTDRMQDTTLRSQAQPYRQPLGESGVSQPHACPPSFTATIAHGDRVWGIADDQRTIWFSAKRVAGEGTWFADIFQTSLELEGPITALGSMDGRLYAFKKRAIYSLDGDGPPENGGDGSEITPPVRVTSDVGCIAQRSVVYCPLGLMFQSVRGIEILSRAGSVEWVGESVQDTLETYPTITSAVCQELNGLVLFTCSNGAAGVTIVWDYLNQAWSVDKVADVPNAQTQAIATHATIDGDGAYLRAHASGVIWRESTTSYRDGTAWVTMLAELPWLKTSGLLGEQDIPRVMVLAQRGDHHGMQIRAGYNYAPDFETILEQEPEDIDAVVASEGRELFDAFLTQAKTTALRVEISDSETEDTAGPYASTSGQGPTWIGVVVMVQGRPGAGRTAKESR